MTDNAARCYALVSCAGTGSRAATPGPKQYHQIAGRSVVGHTLRALTAVHRIVATMVVVSSDDSGVDLTGLPPTVWVAACGGATRAASVASGLEALAVRGVRSHDWVLVHDAARCLVRPHWIDALIDVCLGDPVGGLLAAPLADTLKRADANQRAAATVSRNGLWQAQTPQMFRLGALRTALAAVGPHITDEAGAMEAVGYAPKLVACSAENFKLTHPADFALAEVLLNARAAGELPP